MKIKRVGDPVAALRLLTVIFSNQRYGLPEEHLGGFGGGDRDTGVARYRFIVWGSWMSQRHSNDAGIGVVAYDIRSS